MRETPLLTFTKADDAGCGQRDPGDLDFIVNCQELERWLSNGNTEQGEDVPARCRRLAAELRKMAGDLVDGAGPVASTVELARKRYAERVRSIMQRANSAP